VRAPYNVSRLAQVAAVAALGTGRIWNGRAPRPLERWLLAAPPRAEWPPASQSNFILPGWATGQRHRSRCGASILVRDGAAGLPGHLRISIGTDGTGGCSTCGTA
jgi:histidinol-phosphate/aromatic aminotransferase/cobyric acid decarboxylase-like protein